MATTTEIKKLNEEELEITITTIEKYIKPKAQLEEEIAEKQALLDKF